MHQPSCQFVSAGCSLAAALGVISWCSSDSGAVFQSDTGAPEPCASIACHSTASGHRCHSDVQFCLGDNARGVLNTLSESFPLPLPSGPQDDELCRNSTTLSVHLCTPKDLLYYYKVSLLFSVGHRLLSSQ